MRITEIIPQDDYILFVKTDVGEFGVFDVKPYLNSEVFAPLSDKSEFTKIRNCTYYVEWECGADLSADTILARWHRTGSATQQANS